MLPYLSQGANSAIEDGAVLGILLGHLRSKDQLPKALQMYQKLRKTRGDAIVKETFKQVSGENVLSRAATVGSDYSRPIHSTCQTGRNRRLEIEYSRRIRAGNLFSRRFRVDGAARMCRRGCTATMRSRRSRMLSG